jgi:hypothetical protein
MHGKLVRTRLPAARGEPAGERLGQPRRGVSFLSDPVIHAD